MGSREYRGRLAQVRTFSTLYALIPVVHCCTYLHVITGAATWSCSITP